MITISKQLRAFADMAEAVKEFADIADKLNTLEQAENEARARAERIEAQGAASLAKYQADAQAVERTAKATLEDALKTLATAHVKAGEIVEVANTKAEKLLTEAGNRLNKVLAEVEKESKRLDDLADQIEITEKTRALATEKANEAEARLAKIREAAAGLAGV